MITIFISYLLKSLSRFLKHTLIQNFSFPDEICSIYQIHHDLSYFKEDILLNKIKIFC